MSTSFEDHPQSATIQVPIGNGLKRSVPCSFERMEGKHLIVQAGQAIAPFTVLSIEHEDNLFLGEVVTCSAPSQGAYQIEIKIEQILTGLHNLMALRANLLGQAVPQPLGLMPVGVLN
ncbi:MAG: hypothetical protein JO340_07125 [Acidobacteriaceae bacterium]|nr:hypothetical protein [Acidobacteriaceae bacterium]